MTFFCQPQFNHLYAYRVDEPHTLLDGYPKDLKAELGTYEFDAIFVCEGHHIAHYIRRKGTIKGQH